MMLIALITATGVMAGIYFAFSVFVMKSLAQLPVQEDIRVMNSINKVIVKTAFLPLFFLSSIGHLALIIYAFISDNYAAGLLVPAGVIYIGGMFMVTVLGNVPLNNRLAAASTNGGTASGALWNGYLLHWGRLNHIRTGSCIAATLLMLLAL